MRQALLLLLSLALLLCRRAEGSVCAIGRACVPLAPLRRLLAGQTLPSAAAAGDVDTLQLLLAMGEPAAAVDEGSGWTALHHASYAGQEGAARALLAAGADGSLPDRDGWSSAHHAAGQGHAHVLVALLEAGVPASLRGAHDTTLLHWAAGRGHRRVVRLLLDRGGAFSPAHRLRSHSCSHSCSHSGSHSSYRSRRGCGERIWLDGIACRSTAQAEQHG